jgi:NADH-quinone oxidoreductase subunit M
MTFLPSRWRWTHRWLALVATIGTLGGVIWLSLRFDLQKSGDQFEQSFLWFHWRFSTEKEWLIHYHVGVDGLSLLLVLLTSLLATCGVIAGFTLQKGVKFFYQLFLFLFASLLGLFLSLNLFLFFVCLQLVVLTSYFLILFKGSLDRERAAQHYLLYHSTGAVLLLFAILSLFALTGSLEYTTLGEQLPFLFAQSTVWSWILFGCLLMAFLLFFPVVPFHRWAVRVQTEGHPLWTMLFAGILLQIGCYGLLRFVLSWFPEQSQQFEWVFILLGLLNLLYGAVCTLWQKELKHLMAYANISLMGLVLLGVAAFQLQGIKGAFWQIIVHGFAAAMLFLLVGSLATRTRSTAFTDLGGLSKKMPEWSAFWLCAILAFCGLPGFATFWAQLYTFQTWWLDHLLIALLMLLGLLTLFFSLLRAALQMTFASTTEHQSIPASTLSWFERIPFALFIILILVYGMMPEWLTSIMQTSLQSLVERIGGSI